MHARSIPVEPFFGPRLLYLITPSRLQRGLWGPPRSTGGHVKAGVDIGKGVFPPRVSTAPENLYSRRTSVGVSGKNMGHIPWGLNAMNDIDIYGR